MTKPLVCTGCGNHFLLATNVFAFDQSGPLEYPAPLLCWGCNSLYIPVDKDSTGQPGYKRYQNVTALAVLRTVQPPPGSFD